MIIKDIVYAYYIVKLIIYYVISTRSRGYLELKLFGP